MLRSGACLPVGAPPFSRAALKLAELSGFQWNGQPEELALFMPERPFKLQVGAALALSKPHYVMPLPGQQFDAFVLAGDDLMSSEDRRQLLRAANIPWHEHLMLMAVPEIESRWRYFLLNGDVVGFGSFAPEGRAAGGVPDPQDVSAMVVALPDLAACVLEVALMRNGDTAFLRLRDPLETQWLTAGAQRPGLMHYLSMLWERWCELAAPACS